MLRTKFVPTSSSPLWSKPLRLRALGAWRLPSFGFDTAKPMSVSNGLRWGFIHGIYMVYTWYIHGLYMVERATLGRNWEKFGFGQQTSTNLTGCPKFQASHPRPSNHPIIEYSPIDSYVHLLSKGFDLVKVHKYYLEPLEDL